MYFIKQTLSGNYGPKKKHSGSGRHSPKSKRSTSSHHSHSPKHKNSHHGPPETPEDIFNKTLYCSELYSDDFILDELKGVAENGDVINLTFEDLIERNDPKILQAARLMLVDTSLDGGSKGKTLRGRPIPTHDSFSNNNNDDDQYANAEIVKRHWEAITFIGCVSSAHDYQQYLDKKHHFQSDLGRLLTMRRMNFALPIRFKTKLEIHSMMDLVSIMELLHEVARDDHIVKVRFAGCIVAECSSRDAHHHHNSKKDHLNDNKLHKKNSKSNNKTDSPKEVAKQFAAMVDPVALEWKGEPLNIFVRYGGEDMNASRTGKKVFDTHDGKRKNPATAMVKACARVLEKMLAGNDDDEDPSSSERLQEPAADAAKE